MWEAINREVNAIFVYIGAYVLVYIPHTLVGAVIFYVVECRICHMNNG